jgi:uncharacterized protein YbbK (DUF523 family)
MIVVSACLAGVACRHDGSSKTNEIIQKLAGKKLAVPLCPEVLGGRPVPRVTCEITGGTAAQVLDGAAKVTDKDGKDVTAQILEGVKIVLKAAKKMNVTAAILKTKSPTCGMGRVYDGTFTGKMINGNGVLAEALLREGVKVYTEENFEVFAEALLKENG